MLKMKQLVSYAFRQFSLVNKKHGHNSNMDDFQASVGTSVNGESVANENTGNMVINIRMVIDNLMFFILFLPRILNIIQQEREKIITNINYSQR